MRNALTAILILSASVCAAAPARLSDALSGRKTEAAARAPVRSQWLTAERRAQLSTITSRPYLTDKRDLGGGREELRWSNGARSWSSTQDVTRVLGKPAKSAWRDKLEAKELEKQAILDEVRAVKDKPTKKDLETIINKHGGR